jgi:UPF0271 protein
MATQININCDMGEGYGRWTLGDDAGILPLVPTANIATGFHGGDPTIMRRVVCMAKEVGADIGAHVSLPDLLGFGRRRIDVSPQELQDYVTYQIGALGAFARAADAELTHVKPHGILYGMAGQDPEIGRALLTAVRDYDPNLIVIVGGAETPRLARELGLRVLPEAYCDLDYHPNGYPVIERHKKARDPEEVARRELQIALEQRGSAVDGSELKLDMRTMCIHGDASNAVEVATLVRKRLAEAGVDVVPLAAVA